MKKIAILIALLAISQLIAQTTISSDITVNTTWTLAGSPYIVTDTIEVRTGVRLEIEPSVVIRVNELARIEVDGELSAIGGPTDSIIFTLDTATVTAPIGWPGIRAVGKIVMAYCLIEHAKVGLNMEGNDYSLEIEHCHFRHNVDGISGDENHHGPWSKVIACLFENNTLGINSLYFADIHHCGFRLNSFGAEDLWMCDVRNSSFVHNIHVGMRISISEVVENEFVDNTVGCYFGLADYTHPVTGTVHAYHVFRGNTVKNNQRGLEIFLNDTLRVYPHVYRANTFCQNALANVILPPSVTLPYTVDLKENCWCTLDSLSIDSTIFKNNNSQVFWPIDSSCVPTAHHTPVMPGDANFNQICNYTDLLYLGIAFGETGPLRPNASLSWTPQYGPDWADTLPNGRNLKHADCDGNGTVGFADTAAINQNYGLTHIYSRGGRASGHVPLFLTTARPVFFPGDTVTFEIHLGTSDSMAHDIYGIGFAIGYDTSQVEPERLWLNYGSSWLGNKNQDMITLDKDFFSHGRVDIALTRINHMDRSGHGKIADLIVVIDDDLYKRSMPFELQILESFAWSSQAEEIELQARDGQFNIEDPHTAMDPSFQPDLSLFPVPAHTELQIHHPSSHLQQARLFDLQGKLQLSQLTIGSGQSHLLWEDIPAGFYLIEMTFEEGIWVKKVLIR